MIRRISKIIVHCSATPPSHDIGREEIDEWHRARGFDGIGYHNIGRRNGAVEFGRSPDVPGAHVRGHNADSIGICLVGGVDEDGNPQVNFTEEQYTALRGIIAFYKESWPDAELIGHGDIPGTSKACPCFDVKLWYETGEVVPVRGAY